VIQRIQSVWLFLAAIIASLLFLFPLISYTNPGTVAQPIATPVVEGIRSYYPLLALAGLLTLLPLVTIFLYGNRRRQKGMIWLSIVVAIAFLAVMFMRVAGLRNNGHPETGYALMGPLFPLVSIVFLLLAHAGIRKDEKLIKSLDRLR
jgi:peptidoglycan/LPS O-acetylase OafA/YrhL